MSRYHKLNSAFTTQVKENNAFIAQNLNFAQQLVSALTAFLELPAENPGVEDVEKYLQYLHLDREKGYLAKQELASAVSHFPEGSFSLVWGFCWQQNMKIIQGSSPPLPFKATGTQSS